MSRARQRKAPGATVLSGRSARHTWRDADLAQKGGSRPSSVRGVVRRTTRSLLALRLVEGALLTVAFACVTLSAALMSGLPAARLDAVLVAFATGVAGGLAWFLEQRVSETQVARALDRRLRHGGALVTAWGIERASDERPLARLCVERVLDRLRTKEAVRALMPSLAPPVLLPLAGATLLGFMLDTSREAHVERFLPLDGLEGQLESLGAGAFESRDAGSIDDAALGELLVVRSQADDLRIELSADEPPPDARERLQDLDRQLADLTPQLAADPALAREVDRLRSRLDALHAGLEDSADASATADAQAPGASGDGAALAAGAESGAAGGAPGAGPAESGPGALASGAADGTMSGSASAIPGPKAGSVESTLERGTVARVWWDRIDDPLVADWVELLRATERSTPERDPERDPEPSQSEQD